jgi:hypothetical protein
MPTAICTTCRVSQHWRNQRGVRLSDLRCACGGKLKAAIWTGTGYELRQSSNQNKGRKKAICSVCGHHCLPRQERPRIVEMYISNLVRDAPHWSQVIWRIAIQEDDVFCRRCRPYRYLSVSDFPIETRDWFYCFEQREGN